MSGQLQMDSQQPQVSYRQTTTSVIPSSRLRPPVRQPAARDLPDCLIPYLRTGRGQPAGHATGGVRLEGRVNKEPGTPIARTAVGSPGDPSRWVVACVGRRRPLGMTVGVLGLRTSAIVDR